MYSSSGDIARTQVLGCQLKILDLRYSYQSLEETYAELMSLTLKDVSIEFFVTFSFVPQIMHRIGSIYTVAGPSRNKKQLKKEHDKHPGPPYKYIQPSKIEGPVSSSAIATNHHLFYFFLNSLLVHHDPNKARSRWRPSPVKENEDFWPEYSNSIPAVATIIVAPPLEA